MRRIVLLIAVLSLLPSGVVAQEQPKKRQAPPDIREPVKDWVHFKRDNAEALVATIRGKEARSLGNQVYDIVEPSAVLHRTNPNSKSPAETNVRADKGRFDHAASLLDLRGNVVVTTTDGHRLTTDEIRIECDTKKSSSARPFVMTKPGLRAEGVGFTADEVANIATVQKNPRVNIAGELLKESGNGQRGKASRETRASSVGTLTIVKVDERLRRMTFREKATLEILPPEKPSDEKTASVHDTIDADLLTITLREENGDLDVAQVEASGSVVLRRTSAEGQEITGRGDCLTLNRGNGKGELIGAPMAILEFGTGVAESPRMVFRDVPGLIVLKGPKKVIFQQERDIFQSPEGATGKPPGAPAEPIKSLLTAEGDVLVDSQTTAVHAVTEAVIVNPLRKLRADRILVTADRFNKEVTGIRGWGGVVMNDVERGFQIFGDDLEVDSVRNEMIVNGFPFARIVKAGGVTAVGRITYNLKTGVMEGARGPSRSSITLPK